MGKGLLDPKVDFVFKNIFGSEKHPEILISFLNAIIKPTIPIVGVEIKGTEMTKQFIDDKYSRLDVKATTSNNEIINIEIQLKDEYNMIKILNFKYLKTENFHTGYRLKEIHTHEELTDVIEVHFVEIPKLPAEADVTDMLVAWTEFLKNPESEKVRSLELSIKEVREAKDELIRMSNNEEQRALYEMRAKILKDKVSALNKARREGMEEGLKEGKQEGLREGRQEGLKEGAIRTAKNMIQRSHMTDEEIAEIAELSVEEVKHLRKAISF